MSESVQKKLLRIRPPRVKITYDVETGGAMEKKELPFIVGILADLQGERVDAANYPALKERSMVEIDRDNFNDVMAKIAPRTTFDALKKDDAAIASLLKADGNNELVFSKIEAFEPLQVIKALPALKDIYDKRGKIRDLQARAEASGSIGDPLTSVISGSDIKPGTAAVAASADGKTAAQDAVPALKADAETVTKARAALVALDPKDDKTSTVTKPSNGEMFDVFIEQFNLYYVGALTPTTVDPAAPPAPLVRQGPRTSADQIESVRARGAIAVIDTLVSLIDEQLSSALSSIMHCDSFTKMEATWRGLNHLVMNTETSTMLKLRVFNATKKELCDDMMKAVEFDQSALFKMIYEAEYGTFGGNPYSLLVGDYAIGNVDADIDFLTKMAEVAAAAHAPFLAQASADLFGLSGFDQLDKPRDLKKIFEGVTAEKWREFRELEDSRYVTLALPRALLRLPYGTPTKRNTTPCDGLNFDEHVGPAGIDETFYVKKTNEIQSYPEPEPKHFLWGNPAYLLAERITNAFALYSWTAAIRGVEGGGLVENLPIYTFTSEHGSVELLCPTEVSITDRREKELNDLGFITLCHCKGTGKAAFFGGQTTNQPKKYFSDSANANARISALLPYMLAASRFAHYIKVIMREKIGSFMTRGNVEDFLNSWISNYVLLDDNASQDAKAAYPLREAKVIVTEVPGEPGSYRATVLLKPHFQLEELTTSIRLVANLPK
ncbi:type VI secretion system contractile sheath large subunit [Burkholderia perseverans]|uniref:type VI secretion system contractile sheath large subunit n=1 Tax=Burkholderia perseverans TaxID=2615214 RepID=UPI001FEE6469|nr:type VI secretion system contractile sheath large subunit [Burkholderia perseverans]